MPSNFYAHCSECIPIILPSYITIMAYMRKVKGMVQSAHTIMHLPTEKFSVFIINLSNELLIVYSQVSKSILQHPIK